jgi:hypothetical protein
MTFAGSFRSINGKTAQTFFHINNSKTNYVNDSDYYATFSPSVLTPTQVKKAYNLPAIGAPEQLQ